MYKQVKEKAPGPAGGYYSLRGMQERARSKLGQSGFLFLGAEYRCAPGSETAQTEASCGRFAGKLSLQSAKGRPAQWEDYYKIDDFVCILCARECVL